MNKVCIVGSADSLIGKGLGEKIMDPAGTTLLPEGVISDFRDWDEMRRDRLFPITIKITGPHLKG